MRRWKPRPFATSCKAEGFADDVAVEFVADADVVDFVGGD